MQAVTVRVPATSANLGSAFDTAGIAFDLYNIFSFEKAEALSFEGFDPKFCNEDNLAYIAYKAVCEKIGAPCGVKIDHYELFLEESKLCCIHLLLNC